MADGPEILPVIDPGGREGRAVSIVTDPFMVLESFRRGWHGTFEEAQLQYARARQDTDEYCSMNITAEDRMIARQNLAKLALMLFGQHTKAIQTAHDQAEEESPEQHLHLHGTDVRAMTSEERRAYIAELRRRIELARS